MMTMAYKIVQGTSCWQEVNRFEVDLFGAFEGKYLLEERIVSSLKYGEDAYLTSEEQRVLGGTEYEVYHRREDGGPGGKVVALECYLLVLENYRQWNKERVRYSDGKNDDPYYN